MNDQPKTGESGRNNPLFKRLHGPPRTLTSETHFKGRNDMTLIDRLGKASLRTLAIGLTAMGLALAGSSQANTTTAHAASDGSVWIAEVSRPYGTGVNSYSPGTGADCYGGYIDGYYQKRVVVHPPLAQTGSAPTTIQWWVRLYDPTTGAVVTDWAYGGAYAFPANSAPMSLGANSITFSGLSAAISLRAQLYVRVSDPYTNAVISQGSLVVTQYLVLAVAPGQGYNYPYC
jgi:hypothetical protein